MGQVTRDWSELKRFAEAASQGEFRAYPNGQLELDGLVALSITEDYAVFKNPADADFFAAASPQTILALVAEVEALRKDRARLDWFDGLNRALNEHYGTEYSWKVVVNHNVNRIYLNSVRLFDMNDLDCHGLPSCREAIDAAMQNGSSV